MHLQAPSLIAGLGVEIGPAQHGPIKLEHDKSRSELGPPFFSVAQPNPLTFFEK